MQMKLAADRPETDDAREEHVGSCCGSQAMSGCCGGAVHANVDSDLFSRELFVALDHMGTLSAGLLAQLGCGSPNVLAELQGGERVLELGCGEGLDVLIAALRSGRGGHAYGLDPSDVTIAQANRNRIRTCLENATFLKGDIDAIPLPEGSIDIVISNCVIHRAADKAQVLREAHRVLSSGGRFDVADIVTCEREEREYRELLDEAGFDQIELQVTRSFDPAELGGYRQPSSGCGCGGGCSCGGSGGKSATAFIRARKP